MHQLARAEAMRLEREAIARWYREALGRRRRRSSCRRVPENRIHSWHLFPHAAAAGTALDRSQRVHRPRCAKQASAARSIGGRCTCIRTTANALAGRPSCSRSPRRSGSDSISLPLFPGMRNDERNYVVEVVREHLLGKHGLDCPQAEYTRITAVLGISAFYHDSAAALVVDGQIVAAAQEERFSRRKHDASFPQHAIDYCLHAAGLQPERPRLCRLLRQAAVEVRTTAGNLSRVAPVGFRSFVDVIPGWLREKLHVPRAVQPGPRRPLSPPAAALPSITSRTPPVRSFRRRLTKPRSSRFDGVGEWATASIGIGQGNHIR